MSNVFAKAPPVAFEGGGGTYPVSQQLEWYQQKSKLWLKVIDDRKPGTPVIDEVILLDCPGSFSARWGKPPSPLIKLPPAAPNTPEDLVKEQLTLDAKGGIRDLVAAGDGSVVKVQTDKPPYWAPLELKSGQWMNAPWKATADTLVAAQAGKIYLIDRRTKIVEIWGVVSGSEVHFKTGVKAQLMDSPAGVVFHPDLGMLEWTPPPFSKTPEALVLFLLKKPDGSEETYVHTIPRK